MPVISPSSPWWTTAQRLDRKCDSCAGVSAKLIASPWSLKGLIGLRRSLPEKRRWL
jgi:hypothetical protein